MHAPDVLSNKSFFVAFADGALKAECSSAACPDTLLLFKQTVNLLVQSVACAWRAPGARRRIRGQTTSWRHR